MTKTCLNPECGKPLSRKRGEKASDWEKRVTCGHKCANDAKSYEQRTARGECIVCGGETLPKKRSTGWRLNKTCLAPECIAKARTVAANRSRTPRKSTPANTWTDPAGNTHILPASIALREEYKASIKRRIKRGEGVRMIGDVRVYDGPVTRAAA